MSTLITKALVYSIVTPVITATAYSSGKQVGGLMVFANAFSADRGAGLLQSLTLVDQAKQKAAITLFLFDDVPTVSADTATFDLTDAEMKAKSLGFVLIPSANYQDSSSNSVAQVNNIGLYIRNQFLQSGVQVAGATKRDLYAVAMTTGSPTYASTSDLTFKLGIEQD